MQHALACRSLKSKHDAQVLSCGQESCSTPANAFDRQKELLMAGLFRLLLASVHAGQSQDNAEAVSSTTAAEVVAARQMGFVPLCSASTEAVQLSRQHQLTTLRRPGEYKREMQPWQERLHAGLGWLWAAVEAVPRARAAWVFRAVPSELLLLAAEKVPGADGLLLAAKRLAVVSDGAHGWVSASWEVLQSEADVELCKLTGAV